jgi:hypothetical protein
VADTRIQTEVEDWVRQQWMPGVLGQQFRRERVVLSPGGVFDFDAVSPDDQIVACISSSNARTSGGNLAVGKLQKLRADMLFLLMAKASRRLLILTETDMHELCMKERQAGRVPVEIEFHLATLPESLAAKLRVAKEKASLEVRPRA